MKCFYHNDLDGLCAGAVVYKYYKVDRDFTKEIGEPCEFLSINYNQNFPFDKIIKNEVVIIVDFSLQKEGEFNKLLSITPNVIWIDHHKTAIEKHKHLDGKIQGVRQDGRAGCVLAWEYFYPKESLPRIVEMLGDYDIWNFSKHGEKLNELQAGIRLKDHNVESKNWLKWLNNKLEFNELFQCENYDDNLEPLLSDGKIALQYRINMYKSLIKSWSFFTTFEGYKAIACNAGSVSSQLFDSVNEDYELMLTFVFDGNQWTVSVYTKKENIDCSKIAKIYGGGGHKKAAGFQCPELPFKKC